MSMDTWPFEDSKDTLVFTTKEVIEDGAVITYVTHDLNDGAWQFHATNETNDIDDARMVALSSICRLEPTILELSDLPLGWQAWRAAEGSEWARTPLDN